jgi:hypothetical protein
MQPGRGQEGREGGLEKRRWGDNNAKRYTVSQIWKDLFYGIVSIRKPCYPWGERSCQKKEML